MADKKTDALYAPLRGKWGDQSRANGYQLQAFFDAEQNIVLSALHSDLQPIVDVACGSGLMVLPQINANNYVLGVDYNVQACTRAAVNGLPVLRGDAFRLPFSSGSIGQIVNCQFLNQQNDENTKKFVRECARVLKPGGQLVMTWRHAESWLHKGAAIWLKLRRDPAADFPQYTHPLLEIENLAATHGLLQRRGEITWPLRRKNNLQPSNWLADIVGASLFAVFEKQ